MIVCNFHIGRTWCALWPFKAKSPLPVDANTVLAFSITTQCLQPIAPYCAENVDRSRGMQYSQPPPRLLSETLKRLDKFASGKPFRPSIAEADNHVWQN